MLRCAHTFVISVVTSGSHTFFAVCGSIYELAQLAHAQLVSIAVLLTPRERKRYLGG